MLKFPNKPHKTGKKRAAVAYVLIAVALILCAGVYACRRRPAEPAASVEPAQASPSPQASPAAPAAVAPPALQTPADVQTSVEATARIAEANAAIAQNDIIRARDILNLVLDMPLSRADRETVKVTMTRLANTWLFGPTVLPGDTLTAIYNVRSGDTLIRIARRHKTDHEILMTINNITNPELLRAGRNIKVVNGPFRAVVTRSTHTLDLYLQNTYVRSFRVGLGRPGFETPTGLWEVTNDKQIKPTWTDPDTGRVYRSSDPDYPLGTRWIGLKGLEGPALGRSGFALHGTNKPEELGQDLSRGCIRLSNPDIELLYSVLAPFSSRVSVVD